MLNELVIEATEKIKHNKALVEKEYNKKNYKDFIENINRLAGEVEILLDIAEEIEIISKSKQFNKIELSSSLEMCYKRIVSANPESSVIYKLDNSVKNFRNSLIEIWKESIGKKADSSLNSILALKQLFSDTDLIKDLINRLNRAKDLPKSKQMLRNFIEDIDYADSKIKRLNLNPEIEDFIVKVTKGTARFSDLNDNILNWIHNNKIENKLAIYFC